MVIIREYGCGCKITSEKNYSSIEYCPLHKAAPDLYEACNVALTVLKDIQDRHTKNSFHNNRVHSDAGEAMKTIQQALNKVK